MSIFDLLQQGVKNATKVYNTVDETVFKGTLPLGSAAQLTVHTAILHGIPHTFNGKKWVPSKEYNATNRDTAVELMQKRREESTADQPEGYGSGLSMPGVSEFHEELTSDFKHVPAMSLKVMNPSSTPKAAVELRAKYNSPENRTIFGQSKAVSTPYNSEEYGAGTLYISRHSNGEVKFNPTELNEPSYARARRQLQLMEGVQQALQIAGIGAVGVRGNRARQQQRKAVGLMEAKEGPYINVKPITATSSKPKPSTSTTSTIRPQQTAETAGYDAGWRALNNLKGSHTVDGLTAAAQNMQMAWTDAPTVDPAQFNLQGLIPYNESPPERQRKIRHQYTNQQNMTDRALTYSIEKYYELLALSPENIKRSGYLYPSPEFKRHIGIIKDLLGQAPDRHHAQAKVADAMARLRLKELGNEQDLRIYDAVFNIMGKPGGGVMAGKQKELILLDKPYHSKHHQDLQEAGLEFRGMPSEKLKKVFSTMDATEVIQYMIQLRLDSIPFNKKARAHAEMLLKEAQR